jgi:hypothetical protein
MNEYTAYHPICYVDFRQRHKEPGHYYAPIHTVIGDYTMFEHPYEDDKVRGITGRLIVDDEEEDVILQVGDEKVRCIGMVETPTVHYGIGYLVDDSPATRVLMLFIGHIDLADICDCNVDTYYRIELFAGFHSRQIDSRLCAQFLAAVDPLNTDPTQERDLMTIGDKLFFEKMLTEFRQTSQFFRSWEISAGRQH